MPYDVLLVEDDDETREAIRRTLEDYGLSVHTAEQGDVALRLMREVRPTVVLTDLMMPIMGGWDLLASVSASPDLQGIPLIVMTASATPRPASCYRLLKKPFTSAALESVLNPLVGPLPREAQ